MEHENPQTEAVNEDTRKKVKSKNSNQATVLKQLSNQKLYPLQERIGIYVIAILSTIGLALIIYTGVMALISTVIPEEATVEVRPDIEMDLDGIDDILEDVADVLDDNEDDEYDEADFQQDEADLHVYVDVEADMEIPTEGVINAPYTALRSQANSNASISFHLQPDHEVTILDWEYSDDWVQVEAQLDNIGVVRGFVERQFIDVD